MLLARPPCSRQSGTAGAQNLDLSKSCPLWGISFPIHKVGTLCELTIDNSLFFCEKNHKFSSHSI